MAMFATLDLIKCTEIKNIYKNFQSIKQKLKKLSM